MDNLILIWFFGAAIILGLAGGSFLVYLVWHICQIVGDIRSIRIEIEQERRRKGL